MKEAFDSCRPTSETLVTKLKSQGFFDKIRKRCLENVESNSDYVYVKRNFVDRIVSQFLGSQYPTGNKLELRDQLRRRLQGDASLQHSLRQMSDLLLATHASPESLAPSINQVTCEALNVDYHEWLKMSQKRRAPYPLIFSESSSPLKHAENPAPLLPNPSSVLPNKEPLLPTSSVFELDKPQVLPEDNDVEMEVDDASDEMEVESTDSNIGTSSSQPQRFSRHLSVNNCVPEDMPHNNIGLAVSAYDNKSPLATSPAVVKNSSSFSRKISTAAAAGWAAPLTRAHLDVVSDNETTGGYSPLRRRMSLAGHSAKHSSPPIRSCKNPSLERNPSPLIERRLLPSPSYHRSQFENYGGSGTRRRDSDYSRCGSQRYDRDNPYYNRKQHKDHRSDRYLDPSRHDRGDLSQSNQDFDRRTYFSQNQNSSNRSGHDRYNRNTSPIESRSFSRDLPSRSQSPSQCRRQRQASPHSIRTPDPHYSNPCRGRRPDSSRGRRDSPHSRDHEQLKREKHSRCCRGFSGFRRSPARSHPHRRHASSDSSSSPPCSHRSNFSTPLTSSRLSGRPF